jgi:hypothetical protein
MGCRPREAIFSCKRHLAKLGPIVRENRRRLCAMLNSVSKIDAMEAYVELVCSFVL